MVYTSNLGSFFLAIDLLRDRNTPRPSYLSVTATARGAIFCAVTSHIRTPRGNATRWNCDDVGARWYFLGLKTRKNLEKWWFNILTEILTKKIVGSLLGINQEKWWLNGIPGVNIQKMWISNGFLRNMIYISLFFHIYVSLQDGIDIDDDLLRRSYGVANAWDQPFPLSGHPTGQYLADLAFLTHHDDPYLRSESNLDVCFTGDPFKVRWSTPGT